MPCPTPDLGSLKASPSPSGYPFDPSLALPGTVPDNFCFTREFLGGTVRTVAGSLLPPQNHPRQKQREGIVHLRRFTGSSSFSGRRVGRHHSSRGNVVFEQIAVPGFRMRHGLCVNSLTSGGIRCSHSWLHLRQNDARKRGTRPSPGRQFAGLCIGALHCTG